MTSSNWPYQTIFCLLIDFKAQAQLNVPIKSSIPMPTVCFLLYKREKTEKKRKSHRSPNSTTICFLLLLLLLLKLDLLIYSLISDVINLEFSRHGLGHRHGCSFRHCYSPRFSSPKIFPTFPVVNHGQLPSSSLPVPSTPPTILHLLCFFFRWEEEK